MVRTTLNAAVAVLSVFIASCIPAEAEPSLVSAWQRCEAGKGCVKFAFMPNGKAIEQFPLSGSVVTAYGRYHIRGTVLKIRWKQFTPTQVCGSNPPNAENNAKQCAPVTQPDFKGPFHFEGLNALVWFKTDEPPLRLLRIEL